LSPYPVPLPATPRSPRLTLFPYTTLFRSCELDASDYKELVRRQKIAVKQATADHQQAALTLEVAEIELRAYREGELVQAEQLFQDRKSTRLNSSHVAISYAVFCLKKKKTS